jgi:Holliday junction resolvase RusA-like endonuclease
MDFLQFLNSGLFLPEGIVFKLKHVGRTTLYNWNKARREGGLRALVPRYKWKPGSGAVLVPINLTSTLKKIRIAGIPKRRARYDILPCIRHQWKGRPLECPIQIAIYYSMPIRKGTKMGRRIRMVNRRISHIGNPYLDALNAFIMDCLVGIVFYDHSQIVLFHSEKNYAWWPQTLIVIRPLSG